MSTQSSRNSSISLGYAEMVTKRVQNALRGGLKAYDQVMERECPEDQYDPAHEHVQDVTNALIPRMAVLGEVLGCDIDAVMTLIEDYHHHQTYQSGRIDETRRAKYDHLHKWLYGERGTAFPLTRTGKHRKRLVWHRPRTAML